MHPATKSIIKLTLMFATLSILLVLVIDGKTFLGIVLDKGGINYNFYQYSGYSKNEYLIQLSIKLLTYTLFIFISIKSIIQGTYQHQLIMTAFYGLILVCLYLLDQCLANNFVPKG